MLPPVERTVAPPRMPASPVALIFALTGVAPAAAPAEKVFAEARASARVPSSVCTEMSPLLRMSPAAPTKVSLRLDRLASTLVPLPLARIAPPTAWPLAKPVESTRLDRARLPDAVNAPSKWVCTLPPSSASAIVAPKAAPPATEMPSARASASVFENARSCVAPPDDSVAPASTAVVIEGDIVALA